tara:strand:+ start:4274 stop:5440 length:1167 start_codon:yes stop_codon:yes gene_type:complete
MTNKRKICVITGSRAEYGILKPLLHSLKYSKKINLFLLATGSHLSRYHGLTYREIENDGFIINEKVNINLRHDDSLSVSKSMANALKKITESLLKLKPDIVCLCGDRYEILAAAISCTLLKIPIAHLHGGELTYGSIDEFFRHSITKMSHLHFTSNIIYKRRVIQLGENPKYVFNTGSTTLDYISKIKFLTKKELEEKYKFSFNKKNIMVTYHPATIERDHGLKNLSNLLKVLQKKKDTLLIFTKSNADIKSKKINNAIDNFVKYNNEKSILINSFGNNDYLSMLNNIDVVVGNSSSGIIEAPFFKIATINIGTRQDGRVRSKSIIDCNGTMKSITNSFRKLNSSKFQRSLIKTKNPYYKKSSVKNIINVLKHTSLKNIHFKKFYNLI